MQRGQTMKEYRIYVKNENEEIKDFDDFLSCPHIVAAENEEQAEEIAVLNIEAQNDNLKPIYSDMDVEPEVFYFYDLECIGDSEHKEAGFFEI